MTIGILLMTHPGVGSALLHTATRILDACPMRTKCLEVPIGAEVDTLLERSADSLVDLDAGQGVLVLCDLFGATPSNLACRLADTGQAMVVSGLNLPMLLRVFNYPDETLPALAEKAAQGGARGIHIHARCDSGTSPTHS